MLHLNNLEKSQIQVDAVRYVPAQSDPKILFTCEHATNDIPVPWAMLGVNRESLDDHIGWDIGARHVTESLSTALNQPALFSGFSRLFFDINRLPSSGDAIPEISDGVTIPGNMFLSQGERDLRKALVYDPYFYALDTLIRRYPTLKTIISVHSCTPELNGATRPWEVGVLWQNNRPCAEKLIKSLGANTRWCVGKNQPYNPAEHPISLQCAIAPYKHISLIWLEIRNDLILSEESAIEFSTSIQEFLVSSFLN